MVTFFPKEVEINSIEIDYLELLSSKEENITLKCSSIRDSIVSKY